MHRSLKAFTVSGGSGDQEAESQKASNGANMDYETKDTRDIIYETNDDVAEEYVLDEEDSEEGDSSKLGIP